MAQQHPRRNEVRIPVRRRAWAHLPSGVLLPMEVFDMSPSGLGMVGEQALEKGLDLPIRVKLPVEDRDEIELRVAIQYSNYSSSLMGFRIGAQIREIPPEYAEALQLFIEERREKLDRSEENYRDLLPGGPSVSARRRQQPLSLPPEQPADNIEKPDGLKPDETNRETTVSIARDSPPAEADPALETCLQASPCANAVTRETANGGKKSMICPTQQPCLRRQPLPPLRIRN